MTTFAQLNRAIGRSHLRGSTRSALSALVFVCYGPRSSRTGVSRNRRGDLQPVTYGEISKLMWHGHSEETVARAVDRLVDAGLVQRVKRTRVGWIWAVNAAAVLALGPASAVAKCSEMEA